MSKTDSPDGDKKSGLRTRSINEVLSLVQANDEQVGAEMGIPTKVEVENSDPRYPAFMCDPFLTPSKFLAKTRQAQAIIIVSFATGAMPDRLVPAIQRRLQEGIPVFVLSNNPGDAHGILKMIYGAGKGAYDAGAVGLQKVNVNHHQEVKTAIAEAIKRGLSGQELKREIEQLYAYQEGETLPVAEWDDPNYVHPPRKSVEQIFRDSGFTDDEGNYRKS